MGAPCPCYLLKETEHGAGLGGGGLGQGRGLGEQKGGQRDVKMDSGWVKGGPNWTSTWDRQGSRGWTHHYMTGQTGTGGQTDTRVDG